MKIQFLTAAILAGLSFAGFAGDEKINGNFVKTGGPLVSMPDGWTQNKKGAYASTIKPEFIKDGDGNRIRIRTEDKALTMTSRVFPVKAGDQVDFSIEVQGKGYLCLHLLTRLEKQDNPEDAILSNFSREVSVRSEDLQKHSFTGTISDKDGRMAKTAALRLIVNPGSDVTIKAITLSVREPGKNNGTK